MKGNWRVTLGIVGLFFFFLVQPTRPQCSLAEWKWCGGKFIQVTNPFLFCLFCFVFPLCTSDTLSAKMLTFGKMYVNNQMVVLCTKFCFVDALKGSNRKWRFWSPCEGGRLRDLLLLTHTSGSWDWCGPHPTHTIGEKHITLIFLPCRIGNIPEYYKRNCSHVVRWVQFSFTYGIFLNHQEFKWAKFFFLSFCWLTANIIIFPDLICRYNTEDTWQTLVAIMRGKKVDIRWRAGETNLALYSLRWSALCFFSPEDIKTDFGLIGTSQPSRITFGRFFRIHLADISTDLKSEA